METIAYTIVDFNMGTLFLLIFLSVCYSNNMSFIGYTNDVMIEFMIHFTSHMCSAGKIRHNDFLYLYRTGWGIVWHQWNELIKK
jgi:hypothetical protein